MAFAQIENAGGRHARPVFSQKLGEIEPILQTVVAIREISDLKMVVEPPLLPACYALYNKNIKTLMSSANKKDVSSGRAYILIDYGSLSDENRSVADRLVSSGLAERSPANWQIDVEKLRLLMHVGSETTVAEVRDHFRAIAARFQKQAMTWAVRYTVEELAQIFCSPSILTSAKDRVAKDADMYYDNETSLFFLTPDQCLRYKRER